MYNLNKVILIGSLGKDPEMRYTPSGKAVTSFSACTNNTYTNGSGERITDPSWHNIVVWGKVAENCNQYLKKGSYVYIEGRISYEEYEKDGVKKYITKVVATSVGFLDRAGNVAHTEQAEEPGEFGNTVDAPVEGEVVKF